MAASSSRVLHCEICGAATTNPVWVGLDSDLTSGPEGWQGAFCTPEHGAEWVLAPTEPKDQGEWDDDWTDKAFAVGCLTFLGLSVVAWAVGVVAVVRWLVGWIG